ncbi:MAG: molybdopterin-dependent oxidoreductase [Dehalococcoidales bacterium]|nr:molybdopterin-dependent oxidoreductase [Dehalococcoidales bacterium]
MKNVTLTVNGVKKQFSVDENKVLLDLLREDLGLTGTKQSCDRKGQCGACTVLVDGKAVRSCLKKVVDMDGSEVISVEGLGTPENPHLIQEAFVLAGAIQCGFCTPGMIMATKALLDQNPNPGVAEIKKALARNLCRCTGYRKIIDGVLLAGRFLRNETTPAKIRQELSNKAFGVSHPRSSSILKACGVAKFTADIKMDDVLELAAVLSTEFHAKIKSIDKAAAEKMPGVAGIMTADDIKGTNRIRFIAADQPVLCEDVVRTLGDPIAIVAAKTRDQARAAAAAVKVEYEKLPVMMTPQESLAGGAYQIHKHSPNLCYSQPQVVGDAEKALANSAVVVEGTFSTQMNHQAPLEPEACLAYFEGEGKDAELVVVGRSIMIHGHAGQISEAVGWDKVRYKEPFVGGHFGIKLAITSEAITAAAAVHFKKAARYIPSLTESMLITSKRHPYYMKIKMGADEKGLLTGCINEFVVDKGAYFITGPVIPMRSLQMLSGAYKIPTVYAKADMAYTNNASGGAARGAGPPQTALPLECAMDMLAEKLNMDPLEIRKINSLKVGEATSMGNVAEQWPFPELCDAVRPYYEKAKKEASAFKQGNIRRGVGLACFSFGIAEFGDDAHVAIEMDKDDGVTIYGAVADPGEGNESMLKQIAAHMLNLPVDKVRVYTRDTDKTVHTGAAGGSRITYMCGGALVDAVEKLQKAMKESGASTYEGLIKAGKPVRYVGDKVIQAGNLDPKTGQGSGYDSQVHNIQIAEVEVNTDTGEVKVIKMTSAVDSGPIIHPQNFEGQNEGGMDQGVGWALREEYVHGKTKDWISFKFPTIATSFDVEYIIRETPRLRGPLGMTGIGEMTMTSTAPAVINAIKDACGVWIYDLPATPDKVKAALAKSK